MVHIVNDSIPFEVRQRMRAEHEARIAAKEAEQAELRRANEEARKRNEERREAERKALEAQGREQRIKMGLPLPDDLPAADFEARLERQRLIAELARQKVLAGHYAGTFAADLAREAYAAQRAGAATVADAGQGDAPDAPQAARADDFGAISQTSTRTRHKAA